jgi:hypothetical protein
VKWRQVDDRGGQGQLGGDPGRQGPGFGISPKQPPVPPASSGALQLTLTRHCDVGRSAAVQATETRIRRLRALGAGPGFAATWYDVFPGGCVQIALRPATQQAAIDQGLARQIPAIVGYISRTALRRDLEQHSSGRLRLS